MVLRPVVSVQTMGVVHCDGARSAADCCVETAARACRMMARSEEKAPQSRLRTLGYAAPSRTRQNALQHSRRGLKPTATVVNARGRMTSDRSPTC